MTTYHALAVTTSYWKPNDDYTRAILDALDGKIRDGDFVVISEKAVSTASGNIQDESTVKPSANAKFIARFWMRFVWGYLLGVLCHFGQRLLMRLRDYPVDSGSRHKQVALCQAGFLDALMFGSEGAIDGSNLAFSYVSLPLKNADEIAGQIQTQIRRKLHIKVCVIIADTDKTYKLGNFYFTPRPNPLKGIHSGGGFITYTLGRTLRLRKNSTPIAAVGCILSAPEALKITNIADKARGQGGGATVWDMAARFRVGFNDVTWEMLCALRHQPIVVVREANRSLIDWKPLRAQ
jgi:F420-0:gamma-glutamyl ligase-like protein